MDRTQVIVAPIKLRSNEYWGKRSGAIRPTQGLVFRLKRMGPAKRGNAGPTGWKLNRAPRNYANKKLKTKHWAV